MSEENKNNLQDAADAKQDGTFPAEEETTPPTDKNAEKTQERVGENANNLQKNDKTKRIIILAIAALALVLISVFLTIAFLEKKDTGRQEYPTGNNGTGNVNGDSNSGNNKNPGGGLLDGIIGGDKNEDDYGEPIDPDRDRVINMIGGVADSFVGAVSSEGYASVDELANDYCQKELCGSDEWWVVMQSYESLGKLSKREIAEIEIPDEVLSGAKYVEKHKINYTIESLHYLHPTKDVTADLYVIAYDGYFEYFVPKSENGENISKSYVDSVFPLDDYDNFTLITTVSKSTTMDYNDTYISTETTLSAEIKYTLDRIYVSVDVTQRSGELSNHTKNYFYIENISADSPDCYASVDGEEWTSCSLDYLGVNSISELYPFGEREIDFTYFIKTSYGFALDEERELTYYRDVIDRTLDAFFISGVVDWGNAKSDVLAEYYVKGGCVKGKRVEASIDVMLNGEHSIGRAELTNCETTLCTNFGTTVIERPNID